MRIAIHNRVNSFSDRWIEYCNYRKLDFEIVDALRPDVVKFLKKFDFFLWHWHHLNYSDTIAARYIINSVEGFGVKVFPDTKTSWTFDNKIAQKYTLEAIGAPFVPTYVFFNERDALDWAKTTTWPKVFKLSKGASSKNVRLVQCARDAYKIIRTAFHYGFSASGGRVSDTLIRLASATERKNVDWLGKILRFPQTMRKIYVMRKFFGREIGYVYFQDFIPNNSYDIRITVIGDRAFAFTRDVRDKDFRASGSGKINYERYRIPMECIRISFGVAKKLSCQTIAFDFVINCDGKPLILETSYAFNANAIYDCGGYWDSSCGWNKGSIWPQDAIIDDLLNLN